MRYLSTLLPFQSMVCRISPSISFRTFSFPLLYSFLPCYLNVLCTPAFPVPSSFPLHLPLNLLCSHLFPPLPLHHSFFLTSLAPPSVQCSPFLVTSPHLSHSHPTLLTPVSHHPLSSILSLSSTPLPPPHPSQAQVSE